jgi:flagellar basal body-associated protein FliL
MANHKADNNKDSSEVGASKQRQNLIVIFFIVILVIVIVVAIIAAVVQKSDQQQGAEDIPDGFVSSINKHDYVAAYDKLSDNLKITSSLEAFKADLPPEKYANCQTQLNTENTDGEYTNITGKLTCESANYTTWFKIKNSKIEAFSIAPEE